MVIRNVSWVGIVAHTAFIPLFGWLGHPALAAFNALSVCTWLAAAALNRRSHHNIAMWLLVGEVATHAVLATTTLGWNSGFQYYLIPLIPFVMFNDRLSQATVVWSCGGVFLAFLGLHATAPVLPLDPRVGELMVNANIAIPFLALALVTYFFRLASVHAEKRMERMALTDPLTGLFNRRHMDELLDDSQRRFAREARPFCVILADIDLFKRINDELGHEAGDRVLRSVAGLFNGELRGADAVARWGGEEFLVLLDDTELEDAIDVAHRLREAAEAQLGLLSGVNAGLTVTIGLSSYAADMSLKELLKRADQALYAGKAAGRNQVVVASPRDFDSAMEPRGELPN